MLCIREIYYCIVESMHIVVDNPVGGGGGFYFSQPYHNFVLAFLTVVYEHTLNFRGGDAVTHQLE
jgi:hypothetical protein